MSHTLNDSIGSVPATDNSTWLRRMAPRWLLPVGAAVSVLEAVAIITQAGLIAWIISAAIDARALSTLWPPLLALLGAFAVRAFAGFLRDRIAAAASIRCRRELRDRIYQRIGGAGPLVVQRANTGNLASTLLEGVETLDAYYARYLPQLVGTVIVSLVILITVFSQDWLAGLLLLFAGPMILVFMALTGMGAEHVSARQQQAMARLGGHFLDRLQGIVTLRLFGATERSLAEIRAVTDQYRARSMAVLRVAFLSSAVLEFFSMVAIATVAIYVGFGLLGFLTWGPAPALTLFSGLFVLLLTPEYFQPLRQLAQHYHDRAAALAAAGEIRKLLELPPARPGWNEGFASVAPAPAQATGRLRFAEGKKRPDRSHPRVPLLKKGGIDGVPAILLENVTVRYPGRGVALNDISLQIAAGERVALVGPSGCGKSSLIHLLTGFLAHDSGRIRIFGTDLAELDETALSRLCVWVGQRPVLFHGTVAGNIRMGRPDADAETVRQVAAQAGVTEFIDRLEDGLDAPVGERGTGFSGGQAQRIALARALISPAPILLLDEPTANLDPDNERWILAALDTLTSDQRRTVLYATHRTAGMDRADRIIRLAGGRVETLGDPTHAAPGHHRRP